MLQFGILTPDQYTRATKRRRVSGSGVSLNLLEVSDRPTIEEILRFEEITYVLRTSNGTTRTTFRHRMVDVDEVAVHLMRQDYRPDSELFVQDRAASNCLTSTEWAEQLLPEFPRVHFEASDSLLHLFRVSLPGEALTLWSLVDSHFSTSNLPLSFLSHTENPTGTCLITL